MSEVPLYSWGQAVSYERRAVYYERGTPVELKVWGGGTKTAATASAPYSPILLRGGLVVKAHRLCVSLISRLESNREEDSPILLHPGLGFRVYGARSLVEGERCVVSS